MERASDMKFNAKMYFLAVYAIFGVNTVSFQDEKKTNSIRLETFHIVHLFPCLCLVEIS